MKLIAHPVQGDTIGATAGEDVVQRRSLHGQLIVAFHELFAEQRHLHRAKQDGQTVVILVAKVSIVCTSAMVPGLERIRR